MAREPAPDKPADKTGHLPAPPSDMPAAGPHAQPELTNPDATPGAGYLPDPKKPFGAEDDPD
jgi:hypothetical protein